MNATLTEAHRDTRRVIRAAAAGQIVRITEHGKPLALISPDHPVVQMTAEQFRALEISDADLDTAITRAITEARE